MLNQGGMEIPYREGEEVDIQAQDVSCLSRI